MPHIQSQELCCIYPAEAQRGIEFLGTRIGKIHQQPHFIETGIKGSVACRSEQFTTNTHTAELRQHRQRVKIEFPGRRLVLNLEFTSLTLPHDCLQRFTQLIETTAVITDDCPCRNSFNLGNERIAITVLRIGSPCKFLEDIIKRMRFIIMQCHKHHLGHKRSISSSCGPYCNITATHLLHQLLSNNGRISASKISLAIIR